MSTRHLMIASTYIAFFALIALAMYITNSAWSLLGLIFLPSFECTTDDTGEKKEDKYQHIEPENGTYRRKCIENKRICRV